MRDDSTDTIRLTELFFARDEEALRETARLYEPLCMHIALNILADRQDAEECVNDTWLRAWNHIPPDRPRSMAAYLGTIVRNLAINRWRARRNRALTVDLDELRETIPMTEEDAGELPGLLGAFLARCDSLDRRLFVGRYWYARPVRDMAQHGVPASAAHAAGAETIFGGKGLSDMRAKRRISRETLLRQLGDIPEIYILEAADALAVSAPASDSRTGAENPARRGRDLWWRIRTSPAFAICIGFIVALAAIVAILRAGRGGTTPDYGFNPAGAPSGSLWGETDAMFTRQEKPEDTRAAVPPEYSPCLGRVVVTDGGRMLFVPEDEPALKGCWYYVLESGFGQSDAIPEGLHSGDLVRVYWQYVREVYPPQMPVYRVELIERGRYQDISREARDAIASMEPIVREEETETAEPINSEAETEPTEPTAPEAETYPTEPEPIVREEGSMMTGRIWRAGDAVFFIPEDENGQLSMTEFCLLRDGASGVILLPGTLQTGDRVRVPRGAFLYSDPPILVLKRAPVLVEHGTVDSIDPAIRQQVTDRLSATGLTVSN